MLSAFYKQRRNRYSFRFGTFAILGGHAAGLLQALPGRELSGMTRGLIPAFARSCGPIAAARFAWRWLPLAAHPEALPEELFIDTLCVRAQFRDRGIGTQLLAAAEGMARRLGLPACSLEVDLTNPEAQRLYERLGYRVAARRSSKTLRRRAHYPGYCRMVKALGTAQV